MSTWQRIWGSIDHPAWVRFFVGLGGLVLAFGAALFSTVFRQQGNELGTAIAASLALLLAGSVGLYTVPYLAQRAALEGFRDAMDLDLTREGLVYLGATLVIGVAALNTNNNLLFIVVSAMLAAVLVSGVASVLVLRGLRLDVTLPDRIFARQSMLARVSLANRYRMAVFSVAVVPPKVRSRKRMYWERGVFGWPPKRPAHRQWFRVADLKLKFAESQVAPDAILRQSIYFPYVSARGSAHADVELHFSRRGLYSQKDFGVSTRFPFSFLRKTRKVALSRELIVYPSVAETDELFQVLPLITGEFEAFLAGRGHDLYRIREHQPGDSARQVDWKATAKSQSLKVREYSREDERKLRIVFDNPAPGVLSEEEYEAAVELAASLAWHFSDSQTQMTFVAPGYSGSPQTMDFLHYLALVEPKAGNSVLRSLQATPDFNILITAEPRGTLPTSLWTSSYILFMQKRAVSKARPAR
jgi:uncharacterized protein (DUF58 family)